MSGLPGFTPDIGPWFANRSVLVTGATGFMGKVLVEKLLRNTQVEKIYLLIREKRGKSPKQRLQDYKDHMVIDTLNTIH